MVDRTDEENPVGALVRRTAGMGIAALATVVARRAVEYGWTAVRHQEPPSSSDVRNDTELRDLLLWSALLAAAVVVARKIATSTTDRLLGADD